MAEDYSEPDPVDGFSVEHDDDSVTLTLSNRYGVTETYAFDALSAARVGMALVAHSQAM